MNKSAMKGKSSKYKDVAITNSGKYSAKITYQGKHHIDWADIKHKNKQL